MKTICRTVLLVLLFATPVSLADPPVVTAARSAAEKHNQSIEEADEQLEKALEAARREHLQKIISVKDRMIADLRRAYRTAIRGDTPENAGVIERQIKRLEAQIKDLKSGVLPDVKLKGLDPRLVGFLHTQGGEHGRIYEIDTEGRVTVRYTSGGDKPGYDTGKTYQGVIKDGRLFVHFKFWTERGKDNGRVQDFLITEEGELEIRHTTFDVYQHRGIKGALTSHRTLDEGLYDTWNDIPGRHRGEKPEEPKDGDVDPDFIEEDDEDEKENLDEEIDFFGIPIK